MLYVFHVDAGQMTTYDMNLTLQTVANLKLAIERKTKIPAGSVVLMISGGEVLESDHKVSSYSAGTDTNPIYMFCKPSVKDSQQPSMCGVLSPISEVSPGESRSNVFDGKSVAELMAAVERCCALQPSVNTVISCASLAQQFKELAHEVSRSCEQLVHEQHLQHQGWTAVVANLEDIFTEFCERSRNFKESFRKHRLKKEEYHELLSALNEVLESLGKIPILPALQTNAEEHRFSAFDIFEEADIDGQYYSRLGHPVDSSLNKGQDFGVEAFKFSEEDVFDQKDVIRQDVAKTQPLDARPLEDSDEGVTFKANTFENKDNVTLLHWILAQGNKASLQDIIDYCQKGLALIDQEPLKEREAELCHILEYANTCGLKQIKGIEDRLFGLDQLLSEVRRLERDQHDQAASLTQYRDRLNSSACDPSVLPTLVQSHCCQLEKLLKGHQALVDYRTRIARCKDELCTILKPRLEAVLKIENNMSVQDAHAMLTFQCFNRLERYFDIVRQLHRAPVVFVRAVHEVARRRTFSEAHLAWASELAENLVRIHEEEVSRRQEFNGLFEDHFLKSLFPGIGEMPVAFATQPPPAVDACLPQLTDDDVTFVRETFPELARSVPQYSMENIVKFFQQRLQKSKIEEKDADIQVNFDDVMESETGDFEKLSGQISDKQRDVSTICVPDAVAVSTVTEDNMDSHRIDMEKLHEFLATLFNLCKTNVIFIRNELSKMRIEVEGQKEHIRIKCLEILDALERSNEENAIKFREQTQRLTVDHELELSDMKAALDAKDEVIESLNTASKHLKAEHEKHIERLENEHNNTKDSLKKTEENVKALELKLEEAELQKQKDLKELQDKMHLEYKAEIDSLRSRFRLVALTNMDRSPSESSLEKIERTDVIEISSHNAILMQTKENADVEKEQAVKEAVEKCEAEWQNKLSDQLAVLKMKYEEEKQVTLHDAARRLLAEKDRQLELLREREQTLAKENLKYRETIQQLTDPETNDCDALLRCQLATLENEKSALEQQVQQLKKDLEKKDDTEKIKEDDSDDRSSPKKEDAKKPRLRSHTPFGLSAGTLSLSSCLPGHSVLVLWDPAHLNYTVLQEAAIMYFVHSDSLPALGLSIQAKNESDRRLYTVGVVESKDYCYAKKSGNRYHMPHGSRFYRVRVRPVRPHLALPPCCDSKHKHDTQKSVDTSQSTSSATEEVSRVCEVATGTLINLESPVSASDPSPPTNRAEDQLDSIEAGDQWHNARMQISTASVLTDMECSVGRCIEPGPEPLELTVSAVSVVARGPVPPGSEVAEEASP